MGSHTVSRLHQSLKLSACLIALLMCSGDSAAQQPIQPQCDTFNSQASISSDQRADAHLESVTASDLAVALNFERSNWANGSVGVEDFYTLPLNATGASAGSILKLQPDANTSAYTLPPATALSRFLFQTMDLNGSAIPASAYILWPYRPRTQPDGSYPVIGWGHGTSGEFDECAPSHIRNLWYQFTTPYSLVLQGYVVVAADYAGLGVDRDAEGKPILHHYLANPSHADDIFYSVQAAQSAFPSLSKQFIVMGHSQGGGAAWAAAQRQVTKPVAGYLGAVAGSPLTSLIKLIDVNGLAAGAAAALHSHFFPTLFPGFRIADYLTPSGIERLRLLEDIKGCNSAAVTLMPYNNESFYQSDWQHSFWAQAFENLTVNGGLPIAGPLLVIQGDADQAIPFDVTTDAYNNTCSLFPDSQIEYTVFAGITHSSAMYVSQQIWLDWVADRFAGREVLRHCQRSDYVSIREASSYQVDLNWFLEPALQPYEVA